MSLLLQHWRLALGLLLASILMVYLPALGASFQFDDWNVIVRDPRVQSLAAWAASMPGIRPLLKLSYALSHQLGGDTAGFRAFNIAVHVGNTLLVVTLLRTMGLRLGLAPAAAAFAAFTAALVFALHPVQTEAITYLSGRSTSLSTLFALAALTTWLHGLDTPREATARWLALALLCAALGVKEAPIVLPLMMGAWLVATRSLDTLPRRLGPFLALLLAALAVVFAWPPYRDMLSAGLSARSLGSNLLTQVNSITYLVGQLLRLDGANADPAFSPVRLLNTPLVLRAAALLAVAALGLALLRPRPAWGLAIVWFFIWLLPTNSLVPRLDVVNDRQLYLALVGPAWLLGLGLSQLATGTTARLLPRSTEHNPARVHESAALLGLALLATLLAVATLRHNRAYATEISYWQDVARKSPRNARAANNLGYAYALACRDAEALAEFQRALDLEPDNLRAQINLQMLSKGALFADNARSCHPPPRGEGEGEGEGDRRE